MIYTVSHHLGMGDHIIMNGLVRHIYNREKDNCDKFYLTCFDRNERNVRAMYADLNKLDLIIIHEGPESGLETKIDAMGGKSEKLWLNDAECAEYYAGKGDDIFFEKFGYDKKLIQEFYYPGLELLKNACIEPDQYAFIHDEGYPINRKLIGECSNFVYPNKETPIFYFLQDMFSAQEIHVISSAFLCICIAIPELAKKTTAHLYVRNPGLKNYVESKGIKVII